jgi:predicted CoA-binding protein
MTNKKTLVLGASTNPSRYSFLAINALREHGHNVCAIGLKEGKVADVEIGTEKNNFHNIDTVTLYLGPQNQPEYYGYIERLNPRRVIFNPGTENEVFEERLISSGIQVETGCTLVMLSTGQF